LFKHQIDDQLQACLLIIANLVIGFISSY